MDIYNDNLLESSMEVYLEEYGRFAGSGTMQNCQDAKFKQNYS